MAADDEKSFFKTPLGYLVIIILSFIALMIIIGFLNKGKKSSGHNNSWSNNNYFRRGQVPPSLAGYI